MNFRQLLLISLFVPLLCATVVAIAVAIVVSGNVPSFEQLENPKQDLATRIMSADGELLDYFFIQRRTYLPFDSIPESFRHALIATEDRIFYSHWGVHSTRILQAALKNIFLGKREGASTITQQLARNLFLDQSPTLKRKILEAWTAVSIERTYTKREILELYANTVYFGRGAYGLQVAAKLYFGKSATELTTAESAYLVALLKNPAGYDAAENYERAINRRNIVLRLMYKQGLLSPSGFSEAAESDIALSTRKTKRDLGISPHFVELVRQTLEKDEQGIYGTKGYNMYRDGLVIHTTLNAAVQRYANEAVEQHFHTFQQQFDRTWKWASNKQTLGEFLSKAIRERPDYIAAESTEEKQRISNKCKKNIQFIDSVKRIHTIIQTGVSVLNPSNGAILAMVGSSPEFMKINPQARYSLNHATQILRQPGSAFKPFVYAAALEDGLSPDFLIESGPYSYTYPNGQVWTPQGSSSQGGPLPLAVALQFSINTVAARLITEYTTPQHVSALAKRMGISTPMDQYPPMALGSEEVRPLEITSAFGTFVNQGIAVEPYFITKIEDRFGNIIFERKKTKRASDALRSVVAQQMVKMMERVVNGGTASSVRQFYKFAAAGKTGTTNDFTDAWFVGFTPQLVAGVWVGFDSQKIKFQGWYGQGGKAAAPIWGRLMKKIYDNPKLGFQQKQFVFTSLPDDSTDTNMYLFQGGDPPPEGAVPSIAIDSLNAATTQKKDSSTWAKRLPLLPK